MSNLESEYSRARWKVEPTLTYRGIVSIEGTAQLRMSLTTVHGQVPQPTSQEGYKGRDSREEQAQGGIAEGQHGWSTDLRSECYQEEERESEPAAPRIPHRCSSKSCGNSSHHAISHRKYGQRSEGNGQGDGEHELGTGGCCLWQN